MFVGTNVYGWTQVAQRRGQAWDVVHAMAQARDAGLTGWEHAFRDAGEVAPVARAAAEHGLAMRSAYVFGAFHEPGLARASTEAALAVCDALLPHGATHLVFNPDPLPDGALKSDAELRCQRRALEDLGRTLRERGARLLFHAHAPEMRAAAREFHHMLAGSDPDLVRLCLDVHWAWRGAHDSQAALEDIVQLYADRVDELHLRQSHGGVWAETVEDGDVDLGAVAALLEERGARALLVLEHAYEEGTPDLVDPVEAHRRSLAFVAARFGAVAAE